ncbi:PH domain-containing protein [Kosmotoga pacifica]|uniref:PH domain-containing protein n=1 Tax=Kosmotoga pacifica TaxID=1330330 RepID=UPI0014705E9F|nr:PH domain-containing protein [Kosmotoga pacifica]
MTEKGERGKIGRTILLIIAMVLSLFLIISISSAGITIEDGSLKIEFSKSSKLTILGSEVISAKVIDWNEEPDYEPVPKNFKPLLRTLGTSISDYKKGDFELKNGEKAKLLTLSSKVLVLEVKGLDYLIMLSPDNFDDFIKEVNSKIISVEY